MADMNPEEKSLPGSVIQASFGDKPLEMPGLKLFPLMGSPTVRSPVSRPAPIRRSDWVLVLFLTQVLLVALMFVHASYREKSEIPNLVRKGEMVERIGLTDICLSTEASYTRHLSQADLHTPFQDHPFCLEHFPSGSILPPPPHLKR
jgi:hypothetical protein